MKALRSILFDLLFPEYCAVCGSFLLSPHAFVACNDCWERHFVPYEGKKCVHCGYPLELSRGSGDLCRDCASGKRYSFDRAEFFGIYGGLIEEAIRALKFGKRTCVAEVIGKTVREHLLRFIKETRAEIVVPVPLHPLTLKERGFNQCGEILKSAGVAFTEAVEKVLRTQSQSSLDHGERKWNVKGAFRAKSAVRGRRVLVFDDVFTTGATADEVARSVKSAGAEKVFVYTVARSIKHSEEV